MKEINKLDNEISGSEKANLLNRVWKENISIKKAIERLETNKTLLLHRFNSNEVFLKELGYSNLNYDEVE